MKKDINKNFKKGVIISFVVVYILLIFVFLTNVSLDADILSDIWKGLPGHGFTGNKDSIEGLMLVMISGFAGFVGIFAVLFILFGGLNFIFSFGKEEHIKKGMNIFVNSLIGVVIALLAYSLVQVTINLLLYNS